MRLGIDFGTTRTVVAAAVDGRYPVAAYETETGFEEWIPGLVAAADDGPRFGWSAVELASSASGAERAIRSLKRVVSGVAPDTSLGDLGASAVEVLTGFLTHLRRQLVGGSNLEISPDEPLEAMVAVPANASTRQRYLTLEAFRAAGFSVVGMINEPTAAAIEFSHRHLGSAKGRSPKRYIVVYDLGGGTFDASAVSLKDQRFELLAAQGIARLGGDDFDEAIFALTAESLGLDTDSLSSGTRLALLERCREAKEGLRPTSRRLLVNVGAVMPQVEPVVLSTDALYERCQPLVARTLECMGDVFPYLVSHGIDPANTRELGAVYVVGGAAAFPTVGRTLRAVHGRKVKLAPQPYAATAVGLAIASDPAAGIFVREASTRHFGVWREAEDGREKVFDPIIPKDAAPPSAGALEIRRVYRAAHRVGHLRFLECSRLDPEGAPAGDLTPFQEVRFAYDPGLRGTDLSDAPFERIPELGSEEIVETYTYGADGQISVMIENATRGYGQRFDLGQLR